MRQKEVCRGIKPFDKLSNKWTLWETDLGYFWPGQRRVKTLKAYYLSAKLERDAFTSGLK